MSERIHVYCDESCHLENDGMRSMVLGAVRCPASHRGMLVRKVQALKASHGLPPSWEVKWTKVSRAKLAHLGRDSASRLVGGRADSTPLALFKFAVSFVANWVLITRAADGFSHQTSPT